MTPEDEEFERISREIKRKAADDDDIQAYVQPWVGLTRDEKKEFLSSPMPLAALIESIENTLRIKNS
jgi:hypothetical protein